MAEHDDSTLTVVGLSHQAAPIDLREQIAIAPNATGTALAMLHEHCKPTEAALLSTCNRIEYYTYGSEPDAARAALASLGGLRAAEFEPLLYVKQSEAMVHHAFTVACGLDSMIVGEPEILGQMKQCFQSAREGGHSGKMLGWIFERAFRVAKQVRTDTAIGKLSLSIPALCATVAARIFLSIDNCRVLCIGSGTVIDAVASYFSARKTAGLTIASRSLRNATELANRFAGAQAAGLEEACRDMARFDIVICATGSVTPLLGKGMFERTLRERKRRPMLVFDLGVPRNVEPEAEKLEDLFLHTLDDLGKLSAANRSKRLAAADEAQAIIAAETAKFCSWLDARAATDSIRQLRERIDRIRDAELMRAQQALASGSDPGTQLDLLAARLATRLAHDPTRALASGHQQPELAAEIAAWYQDSNPDDQDIASD